jgi:hypothetical protein
MRKDLFELIFKVYLPETVFENQRKVKLSLGRAFDAGNNPFRGFGGFFPA